MRTMKKLFGGLIEQIIRFLPGKLGSKIRYHYYKKVLKYLGKDVIIDEGVYFINPEYICIGDNTWIDKNVILAAGKPGKSDRVYIEKKNAFKGIQGELKIGKCCHIASFVLIQAHGGVEIGDYVTIAAGSLIYSMSHYYKNPNDKNDKTIYKFTSMAPPKEQCLILSPVVFKNNTALGANSVVLPGSTIGENSWVGANSCVIGKIEQDIIAAGSPAKK